MPMRVEQLISGRGATSSGRRASALFLSRQGNEGEGAKKEERMQDKGSVSRHMPSDCLHILFSRDSAQRTRDSVRRNGGFPRVSSRNRETPYAAERGQ